VDSKSTQLGATPGPPTILIGAIRPGHSSRPVYLVGGDILTVSWSDIQRERLRALGNTAFQRFEKELVTEQKRRLQELRDGARRTKLSLLESRLTDVLVDNGFVQVATPTIMSKGLLARMSIDAGRSPPVIPGLLAGR